jgi:hypothetical protein
MECMYDEHCNGVAKFLEILLLNGISVIIYNYINAIDKQNFQMISGNFATLKYYPCMTSSAREE